MSVIADVGFIEKEISQLQTSPTKRELDHAKSITIWQNISEISEQYWLQSLKWDYSAATDNRKLLTAIISGTDGQLIPPLVIKVAPEQDCSSASKCRNLKELRKTFFSGWRYVPAVACRFMHNDKMRILPLSIIYIGSGLPYVKRHDATFNIIGTWDRHIGDCRREWFREVSDFLLRQTKNKCWYCGVGLFFYNQKKDKYLPAPSATAGQNRRKFQIDHQMPLSRGGSDDLNNLVASCAFCNSSKGGKTLEEFRDYKAKSTLCAFPHLEKKEYESFLKAYKFWFERDDVLNQK